jgi:hypothetical protein
MMGIAARPPEAPRWFPSLPRALAPFRLHTEVGALARRERSHGRAARPSARAGAARALQRSFTTAPHAVGRRVSEEMAE